LIWVKERESHNYVVATNRDALAASGATSALPVPFGSETRRADLPQPNVRIVFLIEINLEQFRFTTPLSDVRS